MIPGLCLRKAGYTLYPAFVIQTWFSSMNLLLDQSTQKISDRIAQIVDGCCGRASAADYVKQVGNGISVFSFQHFGCNLLQLR